jgi:hypothetical protein
MISYLQGRMSNRDCRTSFKIDHSRVSFFVKRRGLKKGEMQDEWSRRDPTALERAEVEKRNTVGDLI